MKNKKTSQFTTPKVLTLMALLTILYIFFSILCLDGALSHSFETMLRYWQGRHFVTPLISALFFGVIQWILRTHKITMDTTGYWNDWPFLGRFADHLFLRTRHMDYRLHTVKCCGTLMFRHNCGTHDSLVAQARQLHKMDCSSYLFSTAYRLHLDMAAHIDRPRDCKL